MDVMQKFKNEFFEERKNLLSKNHVYRNHGFIMQHRTLG